MASNKTWIEKADLVVQDFINEGGYLNDEQTADLFEIQIKESVLMALATVVPMKASRREISKMGFTGRVLRGAQENQALTQAERVRPTMGKTILDVEEFIAECRVPYGALEDHVTQGTLMSHVREKLGKAMARDIEFVMVQGDTANTGVTDEDLLLQKLDGLIKQATSNTVAAGGVRLNKSPLKQMRQTMPGEFKRGMGRMAFITSDNAAIDYGDSLASRATPLGDSNVTRVTNLEYNGSPVVPIPEFPEELGGSSNETVVLLADPKNMAVGIQRDIMIETAKDISSRQWIVVATLKWDTKWIHEPAVVKATGILSDPAP